MSLTTHDRHLIERALLNLQQDLMERAVKDIDAIPELYNAVKLVERGGKKRDGDVSRTQLTALLNMARSQPADEIKSYIKKRVDRRQKVGKPREAAFWDALLQKLKSVSLLSSGLLADCGIKNPDKELLMEAETKIVGSYLQHVVAHCRYRTQFTVEEVQA